MHKYPTLSAMGITEVESIARYALKQGSHSDKLKVYFHSTGDDSQPHSMKYDFQRLAATQSSAGSHTAATELLSALDELQQLTRQGQPAPTREQLLGELNHLEKVVSAKIAEMRFNLKQWH
jgi:type VI protein secretion system component VasF